MRDATVRHFTALLATLLILSSAGVVRAGDNASAPVLEKDSFFTEVGFITGFGYGTVTEGDYLPVPLIVHLGVDMRRWFPSLGDHRGILTVFLEPQFSRAFGSASGNEGGVGLGLKYRYPLSEAVFAYGLVSVGPHFITVDTVDQAEGFIFADTAGVGLDIALTPGCALDLGFRVRHLSNADLRQPNVGIDNYFGTIGFMISY